LNKFTDGPKVSASNLNYRWGLSICKMDRDYMDERSLDRELYVRCWQSIGHLYTGELHGDGIEFNITMILLAENKKRCPTRKDRTGDGRGRFVAYGAPFTIPIGYRGNAYTSCHCIRVPRGLLSIIEHHAGIATLEFAHLSRREMPYCTPLRLRRVIFSRNNEVASITHLLYCVRVMQLHNSKIDRAWT